MNVTPQSSSRVCDAVQPPPPPPPPSPRRSPADTRDASGRIADAQAGELDHLERLFGYYDPTSRSTRSDVLMPHQRSIYGDFFSLQMTDVERLRDYCSLHQTGNTCVNLVQLASLEMLQMVIDNETEPYEVESQVAERRCMLSARVQIYSWFDNMDLWSKSANLRSDTTSTMAAELVRDATPRSRQHASLHRWEVQEYLGPQNLRSDCAVIRKNLLAGIVISGKTSNFEAMTCEEYLSKHWPELGITVLDMVISANKQISGPLLREHCGGSIAVYAFPSHVFFVCTDLEYTLVEQLRDIVQWLCQTLRPCSSSSPLLSGHVQMTQSGTTESSLATYTLRPLETLEIQEGGCWLALLQSLPVAERNVDRADGVPGLEMSFDLMVSLTAVETYHWIDAQPDVKDSCRVGPKGLILLGFFTALIPVADLDENTIQWHFEYTEEDTLRPLELGSVRKSLVTYTDPSELRAKRCLLGPRPQAQTMPGVQGQNNDIDDCALPCMEETLQPSDSEAISFPESLKGLFKLSVRNLRLGVTAILSKDLKSRKAMPEL